MITIHLVQPQEIKHWAQVALPLLDKGLTHQKVEDKYPLSWVHERLITGMAQLWLIWKGKKITGAVMTWINGYPSGKKYLEIFLVGGWKISLWASLAIEEIIRFARGAGCSVVAAGGRLGWNRLAKKYTNARTDSLVAIDLEADNA